jgi:hypothetical protein
VVRSRLKTAGGSFLSSHDPREVLGIGQVDRAEWIEIHWPKPSTRIDRFPNPPVDRYITVTEGKGFQ